MIAYLDLPSGLSGDMFLSCLIDAGWSIESLRQTLSGLQIPNEQFTIGCESVTRGPLRAMQVTVEAAPSHHHRNLNDIATIISQSSLSQVVKTRALAIFTRLAEA